MDESSIQPVDASEPISDVCTSHTVNTRKHSGG